MARGVNTKLVLAAYVFEQLLDACSTKMAQAKSMKFTIAIDNSV